MTKDRKSPAIIAILLLSFSTCLAGNPPIPSSRGPSTMISLPAPSLTGKMPLEESLFKRRSVRDYADRPVTIAEISQLLWAAQGITTNKGNRTAPSAGACYPLVIYLAAGNVDSLLPGLYRFLPKSHQLETVSRGDIRESLAAAALGQKSLRSAPASIIITASYEKVDSRYKDRGIRYTHMEAGHVGQNISLQAVALGLGTVMVGAFDDRSLKAVLNLGNQEVPLYLIPVGKPEIKKAR